MKRELLVKIFIDWPDYPDDTCDEILLDDALHQVDIIGVGYELIKKDAERRSR